MNQSLPNSKLDINQFSTGVSNALNKLEDQSISNLLGTNGEELLKRSKLLTSMVKDLNQPILKAMANDMISVMVSWLDDPQILCCFIQGIWSNYASNKSFHKELRIADTGFAKFLDQMITMLDFIIIFLTQDIRKWTFFIPDFIKEIMNTMMGAILLVLQETLFALRNSILGSIFEWISGKNDESIWSKCLPIKQFINILKKYISDYGFLADMLTKIKGYVGGLKIGFSLFHEETLPNIKDLEFLYWIRDLFIRLKQATLNFDVCVDYEFVPNNNINKTNIIDPNKKYIDNLKSPTRVNIGNLAKQQGYTNGSDGTILVDQNNVINDNGAWIPRLSNSFLREFINKEYSIPYDIIDNTITRGSSTDNIQGTNVTSSAINNIIDRCANTPSAEETLKWIMSIKTR